METKIDWDCCGSFLQWPYDNLWNGFLIGRDKTKIATHGITFSFPDCEETISMSIIILDPALLLKQVVIDRSTLNQFAQRWLKRSRRNTEHHKTEIASISSSRRESCRRHCYRIKSWVNLISLCRDRAPAHWRTISSRISMSFQFVH
jgi:hypothetical protein